MNSNKHDCAWCGAGFDDETVLQEHEQIHRNLDFLLNETTPTRGQWLNRATVETDDVASEETPTTRFQCEECGKSFCYKSDMKRQQTSTHEESTFTCCKCDKIFSRRDNRNRHQKKCDGKNNVCPRCQYRCSSSIELTRHIEWHNSLEHAEAGPSHNHTKKGDFACSKCGRKFSRKDCRTRHVENCQGKNDHVCPKCRKRCSSAFGLRRHLQWHEKAAKKTTEDNTENMESGPSQNIEPGPSQYRCRRCSATFENRRDLYAHGMREHYQTGGALQRRPWDEDDEAPWKLEDGTFDEELREIYDVNAPHILEPNREGPVSSVYNYPIDNSISIAQLMRYATEVYERQQRAFRLNLVFGVILRNRETGRYRYFVPYNNNGILERPLYVSKRSDLNRLRLRLERMDITTELLRQRPDTKWIPVLITNVHYTVYSIRYPVGRGPLPDYLLRKDSMFPLVKNRHTGKFYDDDLCAFR